jgi:[pyruvate, water dikinase]-phosphate phosphotransferase / [pyruvate, water dikinase] kinase
MDRRTVFFVSDQTGVTAETMGHSLLTQFDGQAFRQVTLPFISTVDKAEEAVRRINATGAAEGVRPVIFSTLVQEDMREIIKHANGLFLDFFDAFLGPLEQELKAKSSRAQGRAHGMLDIGAYTLRINATNFALANDDGAVTRDYERADLVLVGVSRSGKTPTCLYMALQYGIFAANFPFAEEEFESGALPASLAKVQRKLYGLTIAPERLQQIRNERRPNSKYSKCARPSRSSDATTFRSSAQPSARSKRSPAAFSTRPDSSDGCDHDVSVTQVSCRWQHTKIAVLYSGSCWRHWNTTPIAQSAGEPARAASSA